MATGASNSDLAVILIDARKGVLIQTRRHAYIASLLGIRHVVLAVNKIDLVDYSQSVFDDIVHDFAASRSVSALPTFRRFRFRRATATMSSPRAQDALVQGPSLLAHLETVDVDTDTASKPFRFPVQCGADAPVPAGVALAGFSLLTPSLLAEGLSAAGGLLVLVLSVEMVSRLAGFNIRWPRPVARFYDATEPLHLVNSYGLFAMMTTWRPELILEGSQDGRTWLEYDFRWKPGDVRRPPRFVAPHQPRLDWQMWFAALGAPLSDVWLEQLRARLLQGSPDVLALLRTNPFPESPPRFVRAVLYDYRFTSPSERRATGAWWRRERRSILKL